MFYGTFTFDPEETVKNFIYLYANHHLDPMAHIIVSISDDKLDIIYDGQLTTSASNKLFQLLTICEEVLAVSNKQL